MIKRSSSEVLYSRLETTAQPSPTGPGTAPLGTAARRVGGRMKPWGAIVAALLDGSIPYWLASGPNYARRIRVRRADMARFDQTDFFEADYRSEEHTSELQSLMRISYAVFCLKK